MLFYDKLGKLIQINKLDHINDKLYYTKIMRSKIQIQSDITQTTDYPIVDKIVKLI
jgi:hypothetical protein